MEEKTKIALQQSIIKWENNVQLCKEGSAKDITISTWTCPLCRLFYDFEDYTKETCCLGCPIKETTNSPYCRGTPYEDVVVPVDNEDYPALLEACQAEVEFLKSLLPKE